MMSENNAFMKIMHWLGHLIFFTHWLYFLSFFISTSRMTYKPPRKKALHIWGFLKAVLLEFNSGNFSKAAVTAEGAFHPKLRLTSCPQGKNWILLTLPKHMDAVSVVPSTRSGHTAALLSQSFQLLAGDPTPGAPQFCECRRHPPVTA